MADLLDRARRREPDALDALVQRYSSRVYGLLYRMTGSRDVADDFLQETFLRMVRTIEAYEHTGRFEAWLFRIAANLARDHARQRARRGDSSPLGADAECEPAMRSSAAAQGPDAALERAETSERLEAALGLLSPADREILMLRHFGDLSFREIAEMLGVPLGTALARAHRALQRLRALMSDEEQSRVA